MRLAAQAKLGFYPINPIGIEKLLTHLYCRAPNPEKKHDTINILDPCAGEGLALRQLREGLDVPPNQTYAVELDKARNAKVRENNPGINTVEAASFLNVQITGFSFGLVYVNPPFDSELGGGKREEQAFAERATRLLVPKGILVLVCPFTALHGNRTFCMFLDSYYEEVRLYKLPDGRDEGGKVIREYHEIVVIGRKRSTAIPADACEQRGKLHVMQFARGGHTAIASLPTIGESQPVRWLNASPSDDREEEIRTWEVPHSRGPHVFKKTMFTDDELIQAIEASPLNGHLKEVNVSPPHAPPLPLDKGHLGLILASGMLDGVVEGPHGVHVVRGSSHKVEFHNKEASDSTMNPETGAVTTKDVFSQRMVTIIRVVEQNGKIRTFSNEPIESVEHDPEPEGDE
jgi:predicted RNA methylase